ncbi:MAG: hypothetical protein E6I04_12860 [Chloroflexi bacterium]|nr:MAG: hypothetical protein E6I04_12860 [Chloroflexota bacterium]
MQPYWLHAYLLVYFPLGLFADSKVTAVWQQDVLGVLTFIALYLAALKAPPGSRAQVWTCVAVATCFEVFSSLVWGIYRYRFHNVPLFVPPGHGMVYLFGLLAVQAPLVQRHGRRVAYFVLAAATAWSLAGVTVLPQLTGRVDVQGLMCLPVLAVFLLRSQRWPLFAAIWVIVAVLEIAGTSFGNWYWVPVAPWTGIPSGNPPSAIAAGYGIIDGSVLVVLWAAYRLGLNTIITRITTTMIPRPGPNRRLRPAKRAYSGEEV